MQPARVPTSATIITKLRSGSSHELTCAHAPVCLASSCGGAGCCGVCAGEHFEICSVMQTLTATSKNATNIGVKIDNFYRFNGSLTEPPCTEVPSSLSPRISRPRHQRYANPHRMFVHYLSGKCACACAKCCAAFVCHDAWCRMRRWAVGPLGRTRTPSAQVLL